MQDAGEFVRDRNDRAHHARSFLQSEGPNLIDLPEHSPTGFMADKAYDSDAIRPDLKRRGIKAIVPLRSNPKVMSRYDKSLYRKRNYVDHFIWHFKINGTITNQFD